MRISTASRRLVVALSLMVQTPLLPAADVRIAIDRPMLPPNWAVLERELIRANTAACRDFFARYFDERGYLKCVERWGGDDGSDDAMECLLDWPLLHVIGAADEILAMSKHAYEGHVRQYTAAKTTDVPFARDGMYYKEFPVMFDWLHNSEGLTVFNLQGLSDPHDERYRKRVRRFAGFYLNEDPGAPNYDPQHKVIRSLFNGSRGPLLRKATALDWAGDPIEVEHRFHPGHGERNYQEMLAHFQDYNDIVGDHPQNLLATSLALNAFALTGDEKYKRWVIEYADAWRQRMIDNGNIIPTNIGLNGTVGGETDGKWYGGVYGWAFSVVVPQTGQLAHRNGHHLGLHGFLNAFLLTGDDRFLDPWRKQIDTINSQHKIVNGQTVYPHMYGDEGWYDFTPQPYDHGALELYWFSMNRDDLRRLPTTGWVAYLLGKNPEYPEEALRRDFARIRDRAEQMRQDTTTPDTRLADDPMHLDPASVQSLVQLMLGGLDPGKNGMVFHCRVRYFDPIQRRAGIPDGVGALVDAMTDDSVTLTLVNVDPIQPRTVTLQAGGYAEHQIIAVSIGDETVPVDASSVTIELAPGCGRRLTLTMNRYVNQPTLAFPWDRKPRHGQQ